MCAALVRHGELVLKAARCTPRITLLIARNLNAHSTLTNPASQLKARLLPAPSGRYLVRQTISSHTPN